MLISLNQLIISVLWYFHQALTANTTEQQEVVTINLLKHLNNNSIMWQEGRQPAELHMFLMSWKTQLWPQTSNKDFNIQYNNCRRHKQHLANHLFSTVSWIIVFSASTHAGWCHISSIYETSTKRRDSQVPLPVKWHTMLKFHTGAWLIELLLPRLCLF